MQLINLAKQESNHSEKSGALDLTGVDDGYHIRSTRNASDTIEENKNLLLQTYPGKLLYSLKDTAAILGVSYEYVRQKVCSGEIHTKFFGDRKMIHLNEVTLLITEGIPS